MGDHRSPKQPRIAFDPHPSKQVPDPREPRSTIHEHPRWGLRCLDLDGPRWGWRLSTNTMAKVLVKLKSYESMTWAEITAQSGRKRNHPCSIDQCCKDARDRLRELGLDDIDDNELFHFGLDGKGRIWCIRRDGIALLLWFDPNHEVCPSEKRHT